MKRWCTARKCVNTYQMTFLYFGVTVRALLNFLMWVLLPAEYTKAIKPEVDICCCLQVLSMTLTSLHLVTC
jgi:hypothetical protein